MMVQARSSLICNYTDLMRFIVFNIVSRTNGMLIDTSYKVPPDQCEQKTCPDRKHVQVRDSE